MQAIDFTNGRLWLEGNAYAAANGAGCLDQIDGLAVLAHDRHIALRQQVAQVDQRFHVGGQEAQGRNPLPNEKIKEGIALSWRGVEHIHRG